MTIIKIYYHIHSFIQKLFLKIIYGSKVDFGKNVNFRKGFSINMQSNNGKVKIGQNVFFNHYCTISCSSKVEIGENTLFGENVKIYDNNHKFNIEGKTIKEQGFSTGEVKIGKNCWIANNVVILKGVTIGNNVVIGAGCIIKENIDSGMIVKQKDNLVIEKINYKK